MTTPAPARGCAHGGADVRTLRQHAAPFRSRQHALAPDEQTEPQPRCCGQRTDLEEYRRS